MSSLAEQKIALAKRILETNDAALLRSVDELVSGRPYTFSAEELASFPDYAAAVPDYGERRAIAKIAS